jgi:hypothetical protein
MILEVLAVLAVVATALLLWAGLARLFPIPGPGAAVTHLSPRHDEAETVRRSAAGFRRRTTRRA